MTLPNFLSALRLVLVVPMMYFLLTKNFHYALVIAVIAGLTDLLDGSLARAFQWQTKLGSFLDPMADKIFIFGCYLSLMIIAAIPMWLFAFVIARDIIIGAGVLYLTFHKKIKGDIAPTMLSKITVALLVTVAVLSIIDLSYNLEMNLWPFFVMTAILTAISLLQNILIGMRFLRSA